MGHPIHKHMHTHITKSNVKAAIKDDKAHMDYLKRDIKDDQKFHVADKDARQTRDEQHITNLAQDVKHDEKKEGLSRHSSAVVASATANEAARVRDYNKYNSIVDIDHGDGKANYKK